MVGVSVAGYDHLPPGAQLLFARLQARPTVPAPPQLDREERRRRVAALRAQGYSHRAIAAELGISRGTVQWDLDRSTSYVPAEIIGLGGQRYPARRPSKTGRTDPLILEARRRGKAREYERWRYHHDPAFAERKRAYTRARRQRLRALRLVDPGPIGDAPGPDRPSAE